MRSRFETAARRPSPGESGDEKWSEEYNYKILNDLTLRNKLSMMIADTIGNTTGPKEQLF
jgi:hypothetical protein